ncbi:MAG: AT hook motif protein [Elusimicrobiota bacterium]
MKKVKEFDFAKARRVTPHETMVFKKAIEDTFHIKRPARGRPPKGPAKYQDVHIRLHPLALAWAHTQAKHCGIGYQTFINEVLLQRATGRHAHHHTTHHK